MSYEARLMPRTQRDLEDFDGELFAKFEKLILGLYDNPRPHNSKKLSGAASKWRIRAGDYRILYEIDEPNKVVSVYRIARRKEVYR